MNKEKILQITDNIQTVEGMMFLNEQVLKTCSKPVKTQLEEINKCLENAHKFLVDEKDFYKNKLSEQCTETI